MDIDINWHGALQGPKHHYTTRKKEERTNLGQNFKLRPHWNGEDSFERASKKKEKEGEQEKEKVLSFAFLTPNSLRFRRAFEGQVGKKAVRQGQR